MKAKHHQYHSDQIRNIYIAEAIRNISENVAKGLGGSGATYTSKSLSEILHPTKEPSRTADEIINDMKNKLERFEQ